MRRPLLVEWRLMRGRWRFARDILRFSGHRGPQAWWFLVRQTFGRD